MTIKKRLFISNILMLIIPAVLAVCLLAGSLLLFFSFAFPRYEYELSFQGELEETRCEAVALVSRWLNAADPARKAGCERVLSSLLAENKMTLLLENEREPVLQMGEEAASETQLEAALAVLHGSGTVSDGSVALFGTRLSANGAEYQVSLYNPVVSVSHDHLKLWALGICLFLLVFVLFAVFLTNRFLTRFVFRRISEPLQTLTEGVHQIRDGNLTHRIDYREKDEFQPICADFNEMAERLRVSVEQTQKEEESRKELLAGISHDIRSPLTSIRAYVEGLLDGVAGTPERQTAYLSTIQKKTVEIDELVRKLFLFSKMELGEYPYSPEPLDAVREIVDFIHASAEDYQRRGLTIQAGPLPQKAVIEADPAYFLSILRNLLDNSAKYKKKEIGAVWITGETAGAQVRLYVDDDGPGVPQEALPKLFNVFYRNDPSRRNPDQGSGLGLAIVWKTVERMGGAIRAENRPGGGLRMVLEIPLMKEGNKDEADFDH